MKNDYNISLVSLGCAKNQVDSEIMIGLIRDAGYNITDKKEDSDIIIVNTCGFIESAKTEAIDALLDAASYKKNGKCIGVIAAGCLAQRYAENIIKEIPEVDSVLGINGYDCIVNAIENVISGERFDFYEYTGDVSYIGLHRVLSTPPGSAYVKISEGCDNRCAYCAIPYIRGPFRSRKKEDIISEVHELASSGIKEIVLVAQDTSRYGKDLYGKPVLSELLYDLNGIDGIEWIRIMYLYPDEIASDLIKAMKECDKVLHYVDLPLQHINEKILKDMNRRGTPEDIKNVISSFREQIEDCVIRTSLIVGFPGESEENFAELEAFVRETRFDRLGVFCYSPEEGTPAYSRKNKVRKNIKELRRKKIMELQQSISREINEKRVGNIYKVLVEGISDDGIFYYGRSYAEGPDVDGKIFFTAADKLSVGDMVDVKVLIAEEYDLTGCQICV